jgi:PAS domain S-box-containing protein
MKRRTVCTSLGALFLSAFLLLPGYAPAQHGEGGNVLCLLSYEINDRWTQAILHNLSDALSARPDVKIFPEFLDARTQHGSGYLQAFETYLLQKYAKTDFRLAVTADDAAFDFFMKFRSRFRPELPVVFCGVNQFSPSRIEGLENVTGVNEATGIEETVNFALDIFKNRNALVVIGGSHGVGKINLQQFRKAIPHFSRSVRILEMVDLSANDAARRLADAPSNAFLLRLDSLRGPAGESLDREESIRLASRHSAAPIFSCWSHDLGVGAFGGAMTSGQTQGRMAGKLALQILQGRPASDIPVLMDTPNRLMVDFNQLQRFKIQRSALPPDTTVVNTPISFYQKYKGYIWLAAGAAASMPLWIALLLPALRERRKAMANYRASEDRYRTYVDNAPYGIFIINKLGRFEEANVEATRLSGYPQDELLGMSFRQLCAPPTLEESEQQFSQTLSEGRSSGEFMYISKNGEAHWWSIQAVKMQDGRLLNFVHDVTERKEKEKQLQLAQYTLDNAATSIFWLSAAGRFLYVNKAASLSLEYSREELLTMGVQDIDALGDYNNQKDRFKHLREGEITTFETLHKSRSGRSYPVEITACNIVYEGMAYKFAYAVDITEKVQARGRLLRESALNKAQADIARKLVSPDITIEDLSVEVHRAAVGITSSRFGYVGPVITDNHTPGGLGRAMTLMMQAGPHHPPPSEAAGRGPIYCEIPRSTETPSWEGFYTNDAARLQNCPQRDSHNSVRRLLAAPAIFQDNILGQLVLTNAEKDYTGEDLRAVLVLADLFALGVAHIRGKARLMEATEKAQAANRAKSLFLANMSHEIRTPLNGVLGMLHLLKLTITEQEQLKYLENAVQACNRLTNLLSDVLDLARVESGKIELAKKEFDVQETLTSLQDLFSPAASQSGLSLSLYIDPRSSKRVVGDSAKLQQVLSNLIGNALKFTEIGGVEIEVYPLPSKTPSGVRMLFVVNDSGCGVPEDMLDHIFSPFTQTEDSYTRKRQGAGLGLSIVKRLVDLMDGSVEVASKEGQGSSFQFCASFESADAPPLPKESQPTRFSQKQQGGGRILVVDDDPIGQLTIQRLLEIQGFEVVGVSTAKQALNALKDSPFDIVFMDIQLPDMDGVTAMNHIRNDEAFKERSNTPIAALTAYAMAGDREKLLASGMDAYLSKPLEEDDLQEVLDRLLPWRSPG